MPRANYIPFYLAFYALFTASAFAADPTPRAVYSITFDEGVGQPGPIEFDKRFLARVTVSAITNTGAGPSVVQLGEVRGSTLPDQFWYTPTIDPAFQRATYIRAVQLSAPSLVKPGSSDLPATIDQLSAAFRPWYPIVKEGSYSLNLHAMPQAETRFTLSHSSWIPALNKNHPTQQREYTHSLTVSRGYSPAFPDPTEHGLFIHPDDWGRFYSLFPSATAWNTGRFAASVIVKRPPVVAAPSAPGGLRLITD